MSCQWLYGDYETGAELVTLLKQAQILVVEGIDSTNQPTTVRFPLTDFAQVYDGPSSEVRLFERRTSRSEEERKLPEEERKRLVDHHCGTTVTQKDSPGIRAQSAPDHTRKNSERAKGVPFVLPKADVERMVEMGARCSDVATPCVGTRRT